MTCRRPPGTRPWRWQALTSRHKGLLPESAPCEATATVGGTGNRSALSPAQAAQAAPAAQAPLCFCSGEAQSRRHCPAMLRTLGLALLSLLSTVGSSQASGFTGEGSRLRVGDAGGGAPWEEAPVGKGSSLAVSGAGRDASAQRGSVSSFSPNFLVTTKEVACTPVTHLGVCRVTGQSLSLRPGGARNHMHFCRGRVGDAGPQARLSRHRTKVSET